MSKPLTIAYQGEPGANSDIVCRDLFPEGIPLPCASFEEAFSAINEGRADLGAIPIENSIAGRVADIHHFLPQSGLHIIGETFLPIRFQLLAVPGATMKTIKTVHSHVHALGQCRKIIREHGWRAVIAGDTAGSAREVSEWKDPTKASLATALAGKIYGLETLAENVEDEKNNTPRFVILSKTPQWAKPNNGPTITTFLFRVRNVPAALYTPDPPDDPQPASTTPAAIPAIITAFTSTSRSTRHSGRCVPSHPCWCFPASTRERSPCYPRAA